MSKDSRGFTFAEFSVAAGILLLCALAFVPSCISSRMKGRESEVKSNIHSLQIALERYAVDTGGIYPSFIIGGEADYNIIRAHIDPGYENAAKIRSGVTPFAKNKDEDLADKEYCRLTKDPLIEFGYLLTYPKNPFAKRDNGIWNAMPLAKTQTPGQFPYGGLHGDVMFDLGFGYGDTPQTDFWLDKVEAGEEGQDDGANIIADPDLDAPGNFYYHPVFCDMIPVYLHYMARYNSIYSNANQDDIFEAYGITSDEAIGYYLYGYGWPGHGKNSNEGGLDIFHRMPAGQSWDMGKFINIEKSFDDKLQFGAGFFLDSTVMGNSQKRVETTGYNSREYDPWVHAFPNGIDPQNPTVKNIRSGPDGVPDWAIIEVVGGG